MARSNRGDSTLAWLVWTIITLLAFTGFAWWAFTKCTATDNSKLSFIGFTNSINDTAADPMSSGMVYNLELRKGGGIIIFNQGVDEFHLNYALPLKESGIGTSFRDFDFYVERPKNCPVVAACFCYVKKFEGMPIVPGSKNGLSRVLSNLVGNEYLLKNKEGVPFCRSYYGNFYLNYKDCDKSKNIKEDCFKNAEETPIREGMILIREVPLSGVVLFKKKGANLKYWPIYIEKYHDTIALGFSEDVITPTDKKVIDAKFYLADAVSNCTRNYWCGDPAGLIRSVLNDDGAAKEKWKLTFSPNYGVRMVLENDDATPKVKEEFLIHSPEMYEVRIGDDGKADWQSKKKVDKFTLRYRKKEDKFVTYEGASKGEFVTFGNEITFLNQMGPWPEVGQEGLPLYVYYKERP